MSLAVQRKMHEKLDDFLTLADYGIFPGNSGVNNRAGWENLLSDWDSTYCSVFAPPGIYDFDTTLGWTKPDFTLFTHDPTGQPGAGGVYFRSADLNSPVMHFSNTGRLSLRGVRFGYAGTGATTTYALLIQNVSHLICEGLSFWPESGTQIGNGVLIQTLLTGTVFSEAVWLRWCKFAGIAQDAITIKGATGGRFTLNHDIDRCFIYNNGRDGVRVEDHAEGIYIGNKTEFFGNLRAINLESSGDPASTLCQNIIISGGTILDGSNNQNLRIHNARRVRVMGNWISFNQTAGQYGVTVNNLSSEVTLQGNAIHYHTGGGIYCDGEMRVLANDIYNNPFGGGGTGIVLDVNSHDSKILANSGITDAAITDVGTNNVIAGNLMHNNNFQLGDLNFFTQVISGNPTLAFDGGDFLQYLRSTNVYEFAIGSAVYWRIAAAQLSAAVKLAVMDDDFILDINTVDDTPRIFGDPGDFWRYVRASDRHEWLVGNEIKAGLDDNSVGGETPLLLLDITAGTLKRVKLVTTNIGGNKQVLYVDP